MTDRGQSPASKVSQAQGASATQAQQAGLPDGKAGSKISLDIKGMEIVDVLKMLALRGNMNIVAGKNVRGVVVHSHN